MNIFKFYALNFRYWGFDSLEAKYLRSLKYFASHYYVIWKGSEDMINTRDKGIMHKIRLFLTLSAVMIAMVASSCINGAYADEYATGAVAKYIKKSVESATKASVINAIGEGKQTEAGLGNGRHLMSSGENANLTLGTRVAQIGKKNGKEIRLSNKEKAKGGVKTSPRRGPTNSPKAIYITIFNKTAIGNLKDDYGFPITIPNGAKGAIVTDKEISLNDGENLMDVIKKELDASNIAYKVNGKASNFTEIAGLKEKINISSSINKNGKKLEGDMSSWQYTLNAAETNTPLNHMKYTGAGKDDITLEDGDEIVIKYTVDGENFDKEYKQSFNIDDSIKTLNLTAGETYKLPADKIKVEPENWLWGKQYGQYFCMSDKENVATVNNDNTGIKITAKSEGKATVTVELPNELSQEITVNVKPKTIEKPEPRILIEGNVWDMNKTFETENSGPHSVKVQVKKNGNYVDVDKNKIKWDVQNGATSRVWNQAFWIMVDHEVTFKATLEEYPNENVFFKAKLKPVVMTDFEVKLPTTYKISAWNNLVGSWSSISGGGYFVGIIEGEGSDNYKIIPTPANAVNKEVTWEALTPEIAIFMEQYKNGIIPIKGGTAKFKVTANANPQISKIVEVKLEYKKPLTNVKVKDKELFVKKGDTLTDLGLDLTPSDASEQRFDWQFDTQGIVENEEIVESTNNTGDLPKFIHKMKAVRAGTVTATGTPWDQTSGAQPVKITIHVIGELKIEAIPGLNTNNKVEISDDDTITYTKGTSENATFYIRSGFLSRLESVKVDGKELNGADYDKESGSIKITLKKAYMDSLSEGTHKLSVETKDGTAEHDFIIKKAPPIVKYKATHEFKSETVGKDLPKEIVKDLLPANIENLLNEAEVTPTDPSKTSVEVEGGKWVFKGYEPKKAKINGADVNFLGSWEFIENAPQLSDADKYTPTVDPIELEFGTAATEQSVKKAVKGIPDDAVVSVDDVSALPNGTIAGSTALGVTVTYKDGSKDMLKVNVVVKEKTSEPGNKDNNTPTNHDKPEIQDNPNISGNTTTSNNSNAKDHMNMRNKPNINTGDSTNLGLYVILAGACVLLLLAGVFSEKKIKEKQ